MSLMDTLAKYGQEQVLRFQDSLSASARAALEQQLSQIDFAQLQRLTLNQDAAVDWSQLAAKAEPPPAVRLDGSHAQYDPQAALAAGEQALRAGRVGMILVAGGQGTRLGFDKPKGLFPIGPISHRNLFQIHCDRLLAVMKRYGVAIPMYIMTSPATDAETRQFFHEHDRCGLAEDQLTIFCQGTMPAVDAKTRKILLASTGCLALSPDGHGGLVAALEKSGCLGEARARGIELFYYAQVDNPLAQLCAPELLGYHLLSRSQMTTQVVKKRFAKERVGNVVMVDGKVQIIEYSDLPDSAAEQTDASGGLRLWTGNTAIHVFDRLFLESVVQSADGLPFHRAQKAVPFIDESGQLIEPRDANAIKFERFVFDLLPLAERAFVVEGDAAQIFAPVKNAAGASVDTAAHAQAAMLNLHRSWLLATGAEVPENIKVEIHPDWALDGSQVKAKIQPGIRFATDTYLR